MRKEKISFPGGVWPVIASGNLSGQREDAAGEVIRMAETGVDAVILITNQFADADEEEGIWMERCQRLLDQIPRHIPLGFYELKK